MENAWQKVGRSLVYECGLSQPLLNCWQSLTFTKENRFLLPILDQPTPQKIWSHSILFGIHYVDWNHVIDFFSSLFFFQMCYSKLSSLGCLKLVFLLLNRKICYAYWLILHVSNTIQKAVIETFVICLLFTYNDSSFSFSHEMCECKVCLSLIRVIVKGIWCNDFVMCLYHGEILCLMAAAMHQDIIIIP